MWLKRGYREPPGRRWFSALVAAVLLSPALSDAEYCEFLPALVQIAEEIEPLSAFTPPGCLVLSSAAFHEYSRQMFLREVSAQRVRGEERIYKTLGVIPQNFNYADEVLHLFTASSSGFYDSLSDNIILAEGLDEIEALDTLTHELRHAQQHRERRLEQIRDQSLTSDELLARIALLEGDAMLFEERMRTHERFGRLVQIAITRRGSSRDAVKSTTAIALPEILKMLLEFPYSAGATYVRSKSLHLRERLSSLPRSSAEILFAGYRHPLRPDPPYQASDDYFEDRVGAAFLGFWVAHWLNEREGKFAREAWRGDRVAIDSATLHWLIGCPARAQCERLGLIVARALGARFNSEVVRHAESAFALRSDQITVGVDIGDGSVTVRCRP